MVHGKLESSDSLLRYNGIDSYSNTCEMLSMFPQSYTTIWMEANFHRTVKAHTKQWTIIQACIPLITCVKDFVSWHKKKDTQISIMQCKYVHIQYAYLTIFTILIKSFWSKRILSLIHISSWTKHSSVAHMKKIQMCFFLFTLEYSIKYTLKFILNWYKYLHIQRASWWMGWYSYQQYWNKVIINVSIRETLLSEVCRFILIFGGGNTPHISTFYFITHLPQIFV